MKAITKILAGGVAMAALATAAPAAAQYYPGYGYPGYGTGDVLGTIINSVIGNGYGTPYGGQYGYRVNSQAVVNQCANAVQTRLSGGYGAYGNSYGGYGYTNNAYAGGRVLGISRVEQRARGGVSVRGVANSGRYAAYGYGQQQQQVDLVWNCRTDYRGVIVDVDIDPAPQGYGAYNQSYTQSYTPWNQDYSQYGYRRY